jgi:hypothetical protein
VHPLATGIHILTVASELRSTSSLVILAADNIRFCTNCSWHCITSARLAIARAHCNAARGRVPQCRDNWSAPVSHAAELQRVCSRWNNVDMDKIMGDPRIDPRLKSYFASKPDPNALPSG